MSLPTADSHSGGFHYTTELPAGGHWSLRLRAGSALRLTDLAGGSNVGMLFYNPENLLERYNAPDTLKAQHTFRLTRGHCLFSDMGRIFASITEDSFGGHDTVCGNLNARGASERYGSRDYQRHRNDWAQNGYDAFLVELTKYGLSRSDMAANVNWFSRVVTDDQGQLSLSTERTQAGASVTLRIEIDTLVLMHACPHPLDVARVYPRTSVCVELGIAPAMAEDDHCLMLCSENARGFDNNRLYRLSNQSARLAPATETC